MQLLVNSTLEDVAIKENINADTISRILNKKISEKVNWNNFKKLGLIGIDEIAIRKGYKSYLTIITSRLDGKVRIIAVLKGREKATVKRFLKSMSFS